VVQQPCFVALHFSKPSQWEKSPSKTAPTTDKRIPIIARTIFRSLRANSSSYSFGKAGSLRGYHSTAFETIQVYEPRETMVALYVELPQATSLFENKMTARVRRADQTL
jgi:hypothetical protein